MSKSAGEKAPSVPDDDAQQEENEEPLEEQDASLPKLLSALALGARAVHGLPLDDEFEYQSSFPEFASLCQSSREALLDVLAVALGDDPTAMAEGTITAEDPWLWEKCAEACDALLEQVEAYLQTRGDVDADHPSTTAAAASALSNLSQQARQKVQGSYARIIAGLVDMEKPQITYGIQPQNDRLQPFIPKVHPDKPYSVVPLDLSLQEGHGLETRFGDLRGTTTIVPDNIVAPTRHVPHLYQTEITSFQYRPWQLEVPSSKPQAMVADDPSTLTATWIDTHEDFVKLAQRLEQEQIREVAVDLEAHSHRTFAGMVCLMQLSFRNDDSCTTKMENFLIDTLKLWNSINPCLAPMFANPDVVKVMHGADADVQWLQRDFGIYVVNLFDTGRAARLLGLSSAGLAYLLQKYASITTDKTHQLSDWRQRPLPDDMRTYAIMDTHYLLDVHDRVKWDLHAHANPDVSVEAVLDASRKVCLVRYDKEPFKPSGYKALLNGGRYSAKKKKRTKSELSSSQERVLASLYDWRDQTARDCDESIVYVCGNQGLLRLSLACPITVTTLQACMNPMPPLVMRYAQDILDRIKRATIIADDDKQDDDEEDLQSEKTVGAPSSAFFKPAIETEEHGDVEDEERRGTGILSPVLGTEALYKQAGWMTPQGIPIVGSTAAAAAAATPQGGEDVEIVTTTTDEDKYVSSTTKPRHLLMVDSANKDYRSAHYTNHSLEMGTDVAADGRHEDDEEKGGLRHAGRTADGLGAARAVLKGGDEKQHSSAVASSLEEKTERAKQNAARIRSGMSQAEQLLGLIPTTEGESASADQEDDEEEQEEDKENDGADSEEDFAIPKSMREIYKISNRNRRRNKKGSSPQNSQSNVMEDNVEPMDVDTLEGAEAVLASRGLGGKGYFDDGRGTADSKRQRTKQEVASGETEDTSEGGGSSGKAGANLSREDDVAFIQEIGWVKTKQEAEEMMQQRRDYGDEEVASADGTTNQDKDNAEGEVPVDGDVKAGADGKDGKDVKAPAASFDYSSVGAVGVYNTAPSANPFFGGAAIAGAPLAQGFGRGPQTERKKTNAATTKDKQPARSAKQQERPEKKDGRTFVYKNKK